MIKPKKLSAGDTVAAISLSWGGPGKFPHRYEAGKKQFEEEFGVTVVETRHALRDPEWLSRNPEARAEDLMAAFSDSSIDGIETSEEAPPPAFLTRFLRSLAAMGVLDRLGGILLGRPGGQVSLERLGDYGKALRRAVREEHGLDRLALVTNMDFGHTDPMFVIPYGVTARIDSTRREVSIREAAVCDGIL